MSLHTSQTKRTVPTRDHEAICGIGAVRVRNGTMEKSTAITVLGQGEAIAA